MLWVALAGFALGFVGSVPAAGPVAILVMARALAGRVRWATSAGLGAAAAEAIYAFIAYVSYRTFLADHPVVADVARVLTVFILLAVAVLLWRASPPTSEDAGEESTRGGFMTGFLISAVNPTLIIAFTAVLSMLAGTGLFDLSSTNAAPFALGVGAGTVIWFTFAARWIGRRRAGFSPLTIVRLYRGLALLALGLALVAAWDLLA
jgi:threonine/homoserine/homoserine lactone efflux protein